MRRAVLLFAAVFLASLYVAWPRPGASHETLTTTVLFDREIVRILDSHCVMCHAGDGPSFPLESYEETWLRRRDIYRAVIARHMPPWAAAPGYGSFANDNSLTLRETQFIVSWVEGLGPRNAGTVFTNTAAGGSAPPAVRARYLHAGHWHLGEPSLSRALPAVRIEAAEPAHVRRTIVDLGLTSPQQVRAVEYRPGDRRVLRAAFFTVQETGQWVGAWTPWYGYLAPPEGAAFTLPAGAHLVAEMHYRGTSEPVVDQGTIGLTFSDGRAPRQVSDLVLNATVSREAGAPPGRLHAETRLGRDTSIVALRPELREGISSIEVAARRPDGGTDILLFARDFDHLWPTPYILREPALLRRGTILSVTAYAGSEAPPDSTVRLTIAGYPAE